MQRKNVEEIYLNICLNKKKFLQLYPDYGSIGSTLKAIGIKTRSRFYGWCKADPKFKEIYETELLPNRRDEMVSVVYRAARGDLKLQKDQLTAAFGFLKATDHAAEPMDKLVFVEKYQHELSGVGGGPVPVRVEIVNTDGTRPFKQNTTTSNPSS